MTTERWYAVQNSDDTPLTYGEIEDGWHFCHDWDGLLVGPGMKELDFCSCEGIKKPITK